MDFSFSSQVLLIVAMLCKNEVNPAPRQKRLTLASQMPSYYYTNIDGHPGTYAFGYNVFDPDSRNTQYRSEEKYPNGTVVGSYGYIDPRGRSRRVDYIADENGYRVMTEAPRRQNYVEQSTENDISSTVKSISWTRPRKPNKKKADIPKFKEEEIKKPSEVLEPPY